MWLARLYLWRWLPGGKRTRGYSINVMRAWHPAWFREDLERLFGLLETGAIRPRVAERISFDEVAEAHRRLEASGLDGRPSCARNSRRGTAEFRLSARLPRRPRVQRKSGLTVSSTLFGCVIGSRDGAGLAQAGPRYTESRLKIRKWRGGHGPSCFDKWARALSEEPRR